MYLVAYCFFFFFLMTPPQYLQKFVRKVVNAFQDSQPLEILFLYKHFHH